MSGVPGAPYPSAGNSAGHPVALNDDERRAREQLGAELWTYWAVRGRSDPFHDWEGGA